MSESLVATAQAILEQALWLKRLGNKESGVQTPEVATLSSSLHTDPLLPVLAGYELGLLY